MVRIPAKLAAVNTGAPAGASTERILPAGTGLRTKAACSAPR